MAFAGAPLSARVSTRAESSTDSAILPVKTGESKFPHQPRVWLAPRSIETSRVVT
jgi:hypothetical protein